MKLGVIRTGRPPRACIPRFGSYPDMFETLLGPEHDYRTYAADEGELPGNATDCDGYVITGGAAGAYDPEAWIGETMAFLRAARGKAALVGVCLGHQLMAEAFGGRVIKSPKGWGVGEHEYRIVSREPWMLNGAETIRLPASHQDQVVEAPPGARTWASSEFTPFAGLTYPDDRAISLQPHPEFEPAYAIELIESRRDGPLTSGLSDRAVASYGREDDRAEVGRWLNNFLKSAT